MELVLDGLHVVEMAKQGLKALELLDGVGGRRAEARIEFQRVSEFLGGDPDFMQRVQTLILLTWPLTTTVTFWMFGRNTRFVTRWE